MNIFPANSQEKVTYEKWSQWQDKSIPKQDFEDQKINGSFNQGCAITTGKIWRGPYAGKYLACIDLDNKKGIDEFLDGFGQVDTLEKLSQLTIVEQHLDAKAEKAHIYFVVGKPLSKRSGLGSSKTETEKEIPAIEVKSEGKHGIMYCSPSIHKNGFPYDIIGTKDPMVLNNEQSEELERVINKIYDKFNAKPICNNIPITDLLEDDFIIHEGNNRHLQVLRHCESEFSKSNMQLTFDELLARAITWNVKHCRGPLPIDDVKRLVEQAMTWISIHNNKESSALRYVQETTSIDEKKDNGDSILQELFKKIPDKNFADYVTDTAKKTIKREDSLISLILYTGLSTFTKDPLNLGIIAPTSEGKTYAVSEVIKLFPKQDVWMLGNMSPKVIIRDRGILVDKDNQPIEEEIQELNKSIKNEKDEDKRNELLEQRKTLYENSKVLIDLSNRILVFLEPPHLDTWNILKPILSHDALEIEHPYVYNTDTKGLQVKHIVTRGWPACIFCSARDDSDWSMWPEIQSRFFIASPNMVKQKYQDSNILIGQKKGLPSLIQEQLIISKEDSDCAQDSILILKKELLANYENNVWIPFQSILSESLPSEKGPDVRTTNRIFSLLNLITKINLFNRPKLVFGDETLAVTLLSDLEEVLKLIHNITGIPSYKLDFLTEIFIPLYMSKKGPLQKDDKREDRIAVYTNELSDYFKEIKGKSLTTEAIKKTYLAELKNNGLVDDFESAVDKRKNGYYPLVDTSQFNNTTEEKYGNYKNLSENDNNLQFFKLILSNNYTKVDENWLKFEILELIKYGIGKANIFKLLDKNGSELCICKFVKEYNKYGSLNLYFQSDENCNYNSKIFGKIKKLYNYKNNE